jgi:hypothetical protein
MVPLPRYFATTLVYTMPHSRASTLFVAALCSLIAPVQLCAEPSNGVFVGTGTCASSNCHGSVTAKKGSHVLQNEYYTWSKHDRHSRAYSVLLNESSKRMGFLLDIENPAKEPLCLSCHATYVENPAQRGPRYSLEDGVSCESCHGAAENSDSEGWLKTHTVTGTTHAANVQHGLADIYDLDKRATMCLSCHYGNDDKSVTHRLYGAGHPRLTFELDTFGALQPQHWVVDQDYIERKGSYIPLRAWVTGQLHHARENIKALESPKRSSHGAYPELSIFDCYSCHHSLAEQQWKHRSYGGKPGELRLSLPALTMLRGFLSAQHPELAHELATLEQEVRTRHKAGGSVDAFMKLDQFLESKVAPVIISTSWNGETCRSITRSIAGLASTIPYPTFEVAEQFGMALQSAAATDPALETTLKPLITALFGTLRDAKSFAPDAFHLEIQRIVARLS